MSSRSRRRADPPVLIGSRVVWLKDAVAVVVNVGGWKVDWTVSKRKVPSLRYYAPPLLRQLPKGKTHIVRQKDPRRGTVAWSFVEKQARTANRVGQPKLPLPMPPQPSSSCLVEAPAARIASVQFLFPGTRSVQTLPRHVAWV